MNDPNDGSTVALKRTEWMGDTSHTAEDHVAAEAPLEIRIAGIPIAVVMRTPGHDEDLVRGFLLSERIAHSSDAIVSVRHCTEVGDADSEDNVMQVVLRHSVDLASLRRNLFASSSCGICGKASIEQAMHHTGTVEDTLRLSPNDLYRLPGLLEAEQAGFALTGGVHAAALFDGALETIAIREDIGRHNAVDKVLGVAAATERVGAVLMVSGRVSFEIVQKALACKVELVAAVSAPSSLAVDLARESRMTLVAFLRDARMCVYSGPQRIQA
ncbi:MAG: formate dehydrogenase accessory sulfurtransferase FdhD [Nannocystaceae bacterium]|nr:formate dehydrogenase accessory sulfurtransferase FdhD [Nannocystaceae bacterium]